MLSVDWSKDGGWEKPSIIPHGPMKVATSATSLHYGISTNDSVSILKNKNNGKL
jgi:branched-chain amino acid aminotransferase